MIVGSTKLVRCLPLPQKCMCCFTCNKTLFQKDFVNKWLSLFCCPVLKCIHGEIRTVWHINYRLVRLALTFCLLYLISIGRHSEGLLIIVGSVDPTAIMAAGHPCILALGGR